MKKNNIIRNSFRLALSLSLLVSTTACTMGRDYIKPETRSPDSFKEMKGWKIGKPNDESIGEAWWKVFNDPQLNALEEKVNISNQNIMAAEARFRQARAAVQAARSGYFPGVNAGASFSRSQKSENIKGSTGTVNSDFMLPADISWEADLWGKIRRTVEASQAGQQASAADLAAVRLSVQAELAQDFFQLRTLDSQKKILDSTVELYEKSLEMARNRYDSGVVSKSDVLQAETQLKSTQAQVIDIGVQRAQLEHAIALLTGQPASNFSLAFAPLEVSPPPIPVGVPSELLERRPDIASAERHVAAANAQIGAAEAAFYPTIRLSAGGGYESSAIDKLFDWPSHFWSFGPSISGNVFDGGLRSAQSQQAQAVYDASVAAYRNNVLSGFQEVEDNLAALRILEEEAKVQDDAVKSAQKALDVSLNQYKAGTVSYVNVIISQTVKLSNEKTATSISGRRMAASVLLVKALGGGWNSAALNAPDNMQTANEADYENTKQGKP
ncbi:efflux transporter outer membrane subunit [Desulforegula conservatrix]|uniref:efflux transporter outer membrane subunit n=1 Tax=Desulforegula conservatrix TaxID=153026 RepID=UPI0004166217|nr:efflux transporter outer membrane subunit [Desulforegula conservatrix]